jgi:Tfp pilus assembly protein PilN
VEVYGESATRPVFSAEFDMAPNRAAGLALSELRLPPATVPLSLEEVLPKPAVNPVENDLSRNALPYATALAGACPRFAPSANVLPPEHRRFNSRTVFIVPAVLAGLMVLVGGAALFYTHYMETQYLRKLEAEIKQLQPRAQRAAALDRAFENARTRTRLLDQFRSQTRADLDAMNELTKLIEPPAWTSAIDLTRDSVRLTGEAPQAAPLINILNSSPFFENSGLDLVQPIRGGPGETFQIHSARRDRK